MGDFGFVGGAPFIPASQLWGMGILAMAAVIGAFVTGWALGKGEAAKSRPLARSTALLTIRT